MRLFFAVDVGEPAAGRLTSILSRLKLSPARVKWADPGAYHVTLSFLGEQDEPAVEAALRAARRAAGAVRPEQARFTGLGAFPDWERPEVVWAGLLSPAIERLAGTLRRELAAEGFRGDSRPFLPHATLGRVKSAHPALREAAEEINRSEDWSGALFHAEGFGLYRSRLTARGAEHVRLAELGFQA